MHDGIVKKISRLTGNTDDIVVNAPKFNETLMNLLFHCIVYFGII